MPQNRKYLWLRWTVANGLAELLGLGATFATIAFLINKIDTRDVAGIQLSFAIAVASGILEATIVSLAQWWAMRPWFPAIRLSAWWQATLVGVLLGYVLGYLPSTLMSMGETSGQAAPAEPAQWVTLLLAAGLGAIAGAVLSFAQWLVLRKHAGRSSSWIPANMLAWAAGMPVIFLGMDIAYKMAETWLLVLVIAAALLAAGLLVGAIHGGFLVAISAKEKK